MGKGWGRGATGPNGTLAYTYDGVGNRLISTLGTATDTYIYPLTSNRLSTINLATGGTRGFTYDAAGNVTAEARPGGTYGYTYNAAGRMSEFKINGVLQASYKYDAMGRQAIRTLSSPTAVTIHSVFDSEGRRIAEYNQASGALIREYVWNGWDPVAVIEAGVISFVRADHIGRPVFATNAAGTKVWSATYQPFGGVHVSTGTLPTNRFPGQWFQSESGLHQNWMRDYDPTTGRYLQADPLGLIAGMNVYGYANQSPMSYIDSDGRNPVLACLINPVCRTAAGAAVGVLVGWLLDPDCFTWEEALGWAVDGALFANGIKPGRGPGGKPKPGPNGPKPPRDRTKDDLKDLKEDAKGPFDSLGEAGDKIGWGELEDGPRDALENLTDDIVDKIKESGVTKEQLEAFEEIYRRAVESGRGGGVAPGRLDYVRGLLGLW